MLYTNNTLLKPIIGFFIPLTILIASCGHADTKADQSDTAIEKMKDTATTMAPTEVAPTNNDTKSPKPSESRGPSSAGSTEPSDIISKIDSHLVSSAQFTAGPSGGITNCLVTVTNNLPDVTFQKALVEVTIQKDDASVVKTAYYTVINIEPGMSKVVKVPNSNLGSKVVTHIVKIKSTELTKGEFVLAGSQFVAPN